ncbi:putative disease resistance protein RGA3 [Magnolia sinica]|uniref:putative disease resistance protein RGA3 n=1 Tax=Magnolia sinica TaxID=86752 RepID=UPI002657E8CB|nr:putative disease resistance protein RGA3 [Magnolia sinica]
MADSLVSFAIEKLGKILEDEVASLLGVTKELEKLSSAFTSIKAVLEDAETRHLKEQSVKDWLKKEQSVKDWLKKLKDVAYDIDDILDEWTTESLPSQDDEGDESLSCNRKVQSFLSPCSCFGHVAFRHKLANRIKDTWERLEEIDREKNTFQFRIGNAERRDEIEGRETGSEVDESATVGRDGDKNEILRRLLNETFDVVNEVPTVISIVGMGGLGKTTLAQLAYNDDEVERHFNVKMWVCVSDDFDVKRITKLMIESATKSPSKLKGLDPLQSCLRHEILHGKRFLLVLDDVWSNDSEKWDKLRVPFQAGAPGSRIIVTTRSEDVASTMGSSHIHKLLALSDEECWSLFNRRALKHRSAEERLELEAIGREIVKKCGGVPLAAKTIGSAMRSRKTRSQWNLVLGSDVWNSGDVLGGILPALFLSYQDLSPALKQCFTYCSVFPKDWEIKKDTIVKLWAAQGFIHYEEGGEIEEVGGLYFDDLLRRSLLQDAELDDYKNTVSCKMHDLVHDLAQSVSGSDCSTVEIRKQASSNLKNIRHSFLIFSDEAGEVASIPSTLYKAQKLRTLLHDSIISGVPRNLFHHLRYLRALNLRHTGIQKLSRTIGQLKHLRYLDLSETGIVELPEEVSNCRNLQTLRLGYCGQLEKLPRGLRKMKSLRHLEIQGTYELKYFPEGIGRLTGLRTLPDFTVGGGNEGWNCRELKYLNHLQGSLQINNVEKVRSRDEAREAELDKKQHLHALTLEYDNDGRLDDEEGVLEILKPHTNLKEFKIWGYKGSKLPKWIEDPVFSNLVNVKLMHCDKCKQLPGLGKLPYLKYLEVVSMEVRYVGGEFSGNANNDGSGGVVSFPKLETLIFRIMPNWEEWELREGDGQVMPSLVELELDRCRKLKALPHNLLPELQRLSLEISSDGMSSEAPLPILPNLNHLEILGNDELTSLPGGWLGQLKALQTLEIRDCNQMESLPEELQHLTKLQQLTIRNCEVLKERYGFFGKDRDKIANIPSIDIW